MIMVLDTDMKYSTYCRIWIRYFIFKSSN